MSKLDDLIIKANDALDRILEHFPSSKNELDDQATAYRWVVEVNRKYLKPIIDISEISLDDLLCIERQKQLLITNTRQFLQNLPANNVLLWGPRGTGKSSLIKAILNGFSKDGLKLIEVDKYHLVDIETITQTIRNKNNHYILFCDDLCFDSNDASYRSLKVALDGSISNTPNNVLIYATSNRRHIVPEYMQENTESGFQGDELHMSEAVEEKISLSERFGLWLSFHPFNQDQYLQIVDEYLDKFNMADTSDENTREKALQWALERGSRSGRCAWQFSKYWAGKHNLKD